MTYELERMLKEAVVTQFKVLSQHLAGRTEEKHELYERVLTSQWRPSVIVVVNSTINRMQVIGTEH
jgi:hypothetical protein